MKKIVFFAPSADIWEHGFPEALVAEMLYKNGLEVTMVRCGGLLAPFCPAGQAAGLTLDSTAEEQSGLCKRCISKAELVDRTLGLNSIKIDSFVDESDAGRIKALNRQAIEMRSQLNCAEDFEKLCIGDQQVGRTALYEVILRHKKNDFEFSDFIWGEYIVFLSLAAQVSLAGARLLRAVSPTHVCTYNSLYVAHRAFCLQANHLGIDQYFMHAGTNLARQHGTLMIGKDFTWAYLRRLKERYKVYENLPISKYAIDDVTSHFQCLLASANSFVFSTALSKRYFDVRSYFGVKAGMKFIVASTSSYDERFAVESVNAASPPGELLFPCILDWVSYLIELAKHRPDWFILIRVHPREFPNRRDRIQSDHVRRMKDLLQDLPANARVNWPDDNVSIYDLAQEADLFLNAWSSVGKEMTLLGLPVVIYCPELVLYPSELNGVGTTKLEYEAAIEVELIKGWSFDRCKKAYRWYALEFSRSCVDMRSSFAPARRYERGLIGRVLFRLLRALIPLPQERWDLMNRKSMPLAQDLITLLFSESLESSEEAQRQDVFSSNSVDEDVAIRASLCDLGRNLFAANPTDRPSKLQREFIAAGLVARDRV